VGGEGKIIDDTILSLRGVKLKKKTRKKKRAGGPCTVLAWSKRGWGANGGDPPAAKRDIVESEITA